VSTADDTFAADAGPRATRAVHRFGRIVVVGGGCYGSYYVRQLARAGRAGAIEWRELTVVDRDPQCAIALLSELERPPALDLVVADWRDYFAGYLGRATGDGGDDDAIVPSPLMPHLMADWLIDRARERWPHRVVETIRHDTDVAVPWQRTGDDGTRYVSFAEWMCPINCIEPARCPHTRGERSWSLPVTVREHAERERANGGSIDDALVFHCSHRAYGVGMIDVRDVLAADETIATRAADRAAGFLVGTVSHCHGALRMVRIRD
jgi:hypothetical protein